jgi:hypothetical protein
MFRRKERIFELNSDHGEGRPVQRDRIKTSRAGV